MHHDGAEEIKLNPALVFVHKQCHKARFPELDSRARLRQNAAYEIHSVLYTITIYMLPALKACSNRLKNCGSPPFNRCGVVCAPPEPNTDSEISKIIDSLNLLQGCKANV